MNRYVDIHAHVLYGIDDFGPADRADAEAMLRTAAGSGTAAIVATPHLRSDFPDVHVHELAARADELRAWIAAQGLDIRLINGAEVGLVWALDADDEALALGSYGQRGGDLLIETPNAVVGIEALLYQVRTRGFRVTLAHPERSREFQRDPSTLEALVDRGILLQVNADAVLGDPKRSPTAKLAQQLCVDGLAHALASDSHRASQWRPVNVMPQAVAAVAELVGAERAEWMAVDSPAAIVAGRPLPEPPPIVARGAAGGRSRATDRHLWQHAWMVNVFDTGCEYDPDDPDGYRSAVASVGREAGGTANTVKLFETPPGQSICPYHYEYEEEWLLVLAGEPTLRGPDGERQLRTGDLVCFAVGPAGAHKLTNRSSEATRVLMWSSSREPAVAVYPDSDKIGVWPGNETDTVLLRRADGARDYFDGEP